MKRALMRKAVDGRRAQTAVVPDRFRVRVKDTHSGLLVSEAEAVFKPGYGGRGVQAAHLPEPFQTTSGRDEAQFLAIATEERSDVDVGQSRVVVGRQIHARRRCCRLADVSGGRARAFVGAVVGRAGVALQQQRPAVPCRRIQEHLERHPLQGGEKPERVFRPDAQDQQVSRAETLVQAEAEVLEIRGVVVRDCQSAVRNIRVAVRFSGGEVVPDDLGFFLSKPGPRHVDGGFHGPVAKGGQPRHLGQELADDWRRGVHQQGVGDDSGAQPSGVAGHHRGSVEFAIHHQFVWTQLHNQVAVGGHVDRLQGLAPLPLALDADRVAGDGAVGVLEVPGNA